jgi:hypothetical protein
MGLEEIIWRNGLYAAQPNERPFAEIRIRQHFARRRLSRRGIVKAVVRYESCMYRCLVALTSFCRPTGWHGPDSHITVDFRRRHNKHSTTHHVYRTDDGYL